jgi:hypothetical protein
MVPLSIQYKDFVAWRSAMVDWHKEEFLHLWSRIVPVLTRNQDPPGLTSLKTFGATTFESFLSRELTQHFDESLPEHVDDPTSVVGITKPLVGKSYIQFIDTARTARFRNVLKRERTTPFILVTSAFALYYYRVTGKTGLVFGSPASIRQHKDFEGLIGWFLATNLLFIEIERGITFSELIARVAKWNGEFLSYRFWPFEKLLRELDLSPTYVDSVFINYINPESTTRDKTNFLWGGHRDVGTPTFDINFTFIEYSNGLKLTCDYRPDMFTPEQIESIVSEYVELLMQVIDDQQYVIPTDMARKIPVK